MNNTFPVCKNCFYHEIPIAEEPCADCQIHFAKDRSKPHFKSKSKPTKADRVRAMSNEELAEFMCHNVSNGTVNCAFCAAAEFCRMGHNGWLDWLKQEEDA